MKNYKSFDLLKEISYERMGATAEETKCAEYILEKVKELGINDVVIEEFPIDLPQIHKAKFEVLEPVYKEYEVTGYGMTGSTSPEGIEAGFEYIGEAHNLDLHDIKGKVVLCHKRVGLKTYKALLEKGAVGFITFSGSVYDDYSITDLEWNIMRPVHYNNGKIPGVTLRAREAHNLILSKPKKVRLTLIQDENQAPSRNVVATIPGTDLAHEVVVFTAHYDSVRFSTGAYDNGTGSTTIYELLAFFKEHQPRRTLKFVWCGAEERGLLGSKAYCEAHKDELDSYKLCINVDMTGVVLGFDIACCTSEKELVSYIDYLGKEVGFEIKPRQGVYSSDSTPFADNGVPGVSFARLAPMGGAEIHSRKDVLNFLDEENYYKTCKFIEVFAQRVVNAVQVPVKRIIPDNMKEELDFYNLRKERPER